MDRRIFLQTSLASAAAGSLLTPTLSPAATGDPKIAVLQVDTDRVAARVDDRIYGQFLEHINHSVEDGLFAEQIQGAGFEGSDFKTYWTPTGTGKAELATLDFQNGKNSVRLQSAGIRQTRIFLEAGQKYEGSLFVRRESGSPQLALRITNSKGAQLASVPLTLPAGADWHEVPFAFTSPERDTQAAIEIAATGTGALLLDFVSMMRAGLRREGPFRPDLLKALADLRPSFIRYPGGSFASTYKWQDGIGPYPARGYHPNTFWGGYSDYYGFGTDEFLALCNKLGSEPLICLAAPDTKPESVEYAMNWVRYCNDPVTTEWGKKRAANGHPEPYNVHYFQIDNEPMNNGFTAEKYAEIVNVYGARLRSVAPHARIVACGQKRSNDILWSEKIIDLAGPNFDILGCHNYEYEPENYETGLRRIREYLTKLCNYVRTSKYPGIEVAVLEWSLQRTYDWRAGLHTAGSLMLYEELSPALTMTCPALLMRNTTDDPTWTSFIYHDHVSWFPANGYVVQKLFREHFAERYHASAMGAFRDIPDRQSLFNEISTTKPEEWLQGSVDAIATSSADGQRIVIKAVNYRPEKNTLLVRMEGATLPKNATGTLYTIKAALNATATLENPNAIAPTSRPFTYAKDFSIELDGYSVAVLEFRMS